MSGNNSAGEPVWFYNQYGEFTFGNNNLTVEEKVELEELRSKVKIYESIANPEKYSQIWHSGFYSGKLAEKTGENSFADMEKFYHEDIEMVIQNELSNLALSEEYHGEPEED